MHCIEDVITADGAVGTTDISDITSRASWRITGLIRRINYTITAFRYCAVISTVIGIDVIAVIALLTVLGIHNGITADSAVVTTNIS
jgi:hypothetical protein